MGCVWSLNIFSVKLLRNRTVPDSFATKPTETAKQFIREAFRNNLMMRATLTDFSDDEIGRIVDRMTLTFYQKDEKVCTHGSSLEFMFVVMTGEVVGLDNEGGHMLTIQSMECGCEVPFVLKASFHALTLITSRRTTMYKISRADFDSIADSVPIVFRQIVLLNSKVTNKEGLYPYCHVRTYARGEIITIPEAKMPDYFYIIFKGSVFREIDEQLLRAPKYFGEEGLLYPEENNDPEKRWWSSIITAQETSTLFVINAEGFQSPEFTVVREFISGSSRNKAAKIHGSSSGRKNIGLNRRRSHRLPLAGENPEKGPLIGRVPSVDISGVPTLDTLFGSGKDSRRPLSSRSVSDHDISDGAYDSDDSTDSVNPLYHRPHAGTIRNFLQPLSPSAYFSSSQKDSEGPPDGINFDEISDSTSGPTASASSGPLPSLGAAMVRMGLPAAIIGGCLGWSDVDYSNVYNVDTSEPSVRVRTPKKRGKKGRRPDLYGDDQPADLTCEKTGETEAQLSRGNISNSRSDSKQFTSPRRSAVLASPSSASTASMTSSPPASAPSSPTVRLTLLTPSPSSSPSFRATTRGGNSSQHSFYDTPHSPAAHTDAKNGSNRFSTNSSCYGTATDRI